VIPERTLTTVGDFCTLDAGCVLQGHSLEDGIFKRDRLVIGDGCTIGASAFIHYGVVMGPQSALEPNSFLMKGERPAAHSVWAGNPAREVQVGQCLSDPARTAIEQPLAASLAPEAGDR
jgi:non-ribosomal peptide synthetase-like protein